MPDCDFVNASKKLDSLIQSGIKLGLENTERLLVGLGNPHINLPIIHIAGTNGKGSTAAFLSAAFHHAGYKTGFFCSPHLISITERFRINGKSISNDAFASYVNRIFDEVPELFEGDDTATYFEFVTALALLYFKEQNCDIIILEVGMGGRLDSTNVVSPLISVISNIGYDHMDALGNTLAEIAAEKAGIIKPGIPVICGNMPEEALSKIEEIATEQGSEMIRYGSDYKGLSYTIENHLIQKNNIQFAGAEHQINTRLIGPHQLKNLALAWAVINTVKRLYFPDLSHDKAIKGLELASWPARLQHLKNGMLLDAAHNPDAIEIVITAMQEMKADQMWHLLFATLNTKDWQGLLNRIIPKIASITVCPLNHHRSENPDNIAAYIHEHFPHMDLNVSSNVEDAMKKLKKQEPTIILGSLYLAGDVLTFFNESVEIESQ